jgi:hypothetical protein
MTYSKDRQFGAYSIDITILGKLSCSNKNKKSYVYKNNLLYSTWIFAAAKLDGKF